MSDNAPRFSTRSLPQQQESLSGHECIHQRGIVTRGSSTVSNQCCQPVDVLHTASGKLFASVYALFSGVFVLAVAGLLFAPVLHRLLHRFHLERDERDSAGDDVS
jgi:hypothetical protein